MDSSNAANIENAIQSNTKLIWIETPTNPLLKITDLEAVGNIAKKHNILFGVDSTFATPVFLRPLEFGADLVMHSTTKYLSGHNQLIGGVVITNREDLYDKLKWENEISSALSVTMAYMPGKRYESRLFKAIDIFVFQDCSFV